MQLVGAPSPRAAELIAQTLALLGLKRGWVVHGLDGLDEISTLGETVSTRFRAAPSPTGPSNPATSACRRRLEDLRGGGREENATIAREVLNGVKGVRRDMVLVNAAAALVAAGRAANFMQGMAVAAESVDSGAALGKLERLVSFSALARDEHD